MDDYHKNFENIDYFIKKKDLPKKFSQKKVTFESTPLFFPPGLEKIFLIIYFISLPYLTGIIFLFLIARGKIEVFFSFYEESSFIIVWAMGYEILAVIILLFIAKSAISFSKKLKKEGKQRFQIP